MQIKRSRSRSKGWDYTRAWRPGGGDHGRLLTHPGNIFKVQSTTSMCMVAPTDSFPERVPQQQQSHSKPVPKSLHLKVSYEQVMISINEAPIKIQSHPSML